MNDLIGKGFSQAMAYFYRLFELRFFLFSLVRNDLNVRYRRSFLGIAWSLARPIGMTTVLCIVFRTIFQLELKDFAPFLFIGVAVWQFVVESMLSGCQSFMVGASYIRQQPIPLALFPLRTVLVAGFHTGIALMVGIAVTWYFLGLPSLLMLASLVPVLLVVFLIGLSFAIVCGAIHTHFPDTQHLLEIVMQAMFYLTPVMYRPDTFKSNGLLSTIMAYNPFSSILEMIRCPLLNGTFPALKLWEVALTFLAVMGTLSWLILRKFQRELVFWV